jgi:hypothetical protein
VPQLVDEIKLNSLLSGFLGLIGVPLKAYAKVTKHTFRIKTVLNLRELKI